MRLFHQSRLLFNGSSPLEEERKVDSLDTTSTWRSENTESTRRELALFTQAQDLLLETTLKSLQKRVKKLELLLQVHSVQQLERILVWLTLTTLTMKLELD